MPKPAAKSIRSNTVRIIAGQYRRRLLTFPDGDGLRPTPDRVRETLFNWLGQELHGMHCLDLFAGAGALGFEAASRGAARVVMIEMARPARPRTPTPGKDFGPPKRGQYPSRSFDPHVRSFVATICVVIRQR